MPDSTTWVEQANLNQITNQINQLQVSVNDLSYDIGRILSALNWGNTPTALTIDVANQQILAKDGTLIMSGIATVTSNYNLRIPGRVCAFLASQPNIRTLKSGRERM